MKTRKKKLSKFLKVGVCLLGISLLLWSCEKEEEKVLFNEIQQEKTITHISLDEFTLNVTKNSKFKKLATFFDVKKNQSKIRTKVNNYLSVRILTNDIIKIKREAFTSYTFRMLLQNDDDFMYNLVLYVNNRNEIYKSFILKYIPSEQRILDTSSYFKGKVSLLKKDILLTNNLILLRENADCLTGGTTYWECSYGYEHAPGTCNASSFEYIMELEYGECNNGGDGEITVTPTDSSEGGASGGSQDGGIVTAPHTTSYTSELKNFVSGTLNAEERNYYTSHNNIKNTIDTYLIQKNFSNLAKFEAKLAVEFGNDLNLNPQNFIWFFNNRNSKEVQDIKDFLAVNNNAIEAEEFAIKAIESKSSKYLNENFELTKNSPFNVDMAQVLDSIDLPANDPNKIANQKFLCIYNKIIKSPKFKSLFTNVFGEHKAINAKFVIANDFPTNPVTNLQSNGNCRLENYTLTSDGSIKAANVLIKINQNKLTTGNTREISSILMAKTIIHESIHAFLSVKVKDCNIGITIDQLNNLEFEELIKEYYDGTCATGQEQHQFMFDYLEPILSEILTDIRDDVIPASQIRRMDSETLYVNGISTPFNWDDFFFNLSLEGLHNTEAFENEIKSDIVKNEKFEKYIGIFAVRFSKNCNN